MSRRKHALVVGVLVDMREDMSEKVLDAVEQLVFALIELKLFLVSTLVHMDADELDEVDDQLDPVERVLLGHFRLQESSEVIVFDQRRTVFHLRVQPAQIVLDQIEQQIEENVDD